MKSGVYHVMSVSFLLMLLLQSCVPIEDQRSSSLHGVALPELTICRPVVCWQGLSLASMSPENVQAYARRIPGFENAEIDRIWNKGDLSTFGWRDAGGHNIYVTFQNSQGVALHQSASPVEFGDVVARFGDPSHVFVWSHAATGRLTASVVVVFAAQGLVVYSGAEKIGSSGVTLSSHVSVVGYNMAGSPGLEQAIGSLQLASDHLPSEQGFDLDTYIAKAQPWQGFGNYRADQP